MAVRAVEYSHTPRTSGGPAHVRLRQTLKRYHVFALYQDALDVAGLVSAKLNNKSSNDEPPDVSSLFADALLIATVLGDLDNRAVATVTGSMFRMTRPNWRLCSVQRRPSGSLAMRLVRPPLSVLGLPVWKSIYAGTAVDDPVLALGQTIAGRDRPDGDVHRLRRLYYELPLRAQRPPRLSDDRYSVPQFWSGIVGDAPVQRSTLDAWITSVETGLPKSDLIGRLTCLLRASVFVDGSLTLSPRP